MRTIKEPLKEPIWDGWSIGVDSAKKLDKFLQKKRPKTAIELGSGSTTLLLAKYCRRVISLEHKPTFCLITRKLLKDSRLKAEVRYSPLGKFSKGYFYKTGPLPKADFILIDGPPQVYGRIATLYYLMPYIKKDTVIWLDDTCRPAEAKALVKWQKDFKLKLKPVNYRITQIELQR